MIKEVIVETKKGDITCYELTHYAFTTSKGTFTLSATHSNGTDEWKHTAERTFHTWSRQEVYNWWIDEKIEVVGEATEILCSKIENKAKIKRSKRLKK